MSPGEVSRSNPGPRGMTPLLPPWICEKEVDHKEAMRQHGKCPMCWRGFTEDEIRNAYSKKRKP